jgi:hypothetical protein
MITAHKYDLKLLMPAPPIGDRRQRCSSTSGPGMEQVAQKHKSLSVRGIQRSIQPHQVRVCRSARDGNPGAAERGSFAKMRIRHQQRLLVVPVNSPLREKC